MRFLRKPEAAARVGYHPEHVMRLVRQDRFPKPVRLGPNSIAFVEDEVEAWMAARVADRDAKIGEEAAQT